MAIMHVDVDTIKKNILPSNDLIDIEKDHIEA